MVHSDEIPKDVKLQWTSEQKKTISNRSTAFLALFANCTKWILKCIIYTQDFTDAETYLSKTGKLQENMLSSKVTKRTFNKGTSKIPERFKN